MPTFKNFNHFVKDMCMHTKNPNKGTQLQT